MKEKLAQIGYKIQKFMYGRYGMDELYKVFFIIYLVLIVVDMIIRNSVVSTVLLVLSLAVLFFMFCRVFSKKIDKRRAENNKYLSIKYKITKKINYQKDKWKYRKTHVFRTCPNCKRHLKLPKKKGSHTVNCPCCKTSFKVKVL